MGTSSAADNGHLPLKLTNPLPTVSTKLPGLACARGSGEPRGFAMLHVPYSMSQCQNWPCRGSRFGVAGRVIGVSTDIMESVSCIPDSHRPRGGRIATPALRSHSMSFVTIHLAYPAHGPPVDAHHHAFIQYNMACSITNCSIMHPSRHWAKCGSWGTTGSSDGDKNLGKRLD